jgi:hypothetical protein
MNNIHRRIKMFDTVRNRASFASSFLTLALSFGLLFSVTACNKKTNPESAQDAPKTFASPDDAGKALADAARSQNQDSILAIFGQGSAPIVSTGNSAEDKAALNGFVQDYQVMNRWRKLADGSELLLVGAENQAFPIPLMKNAAGQWYFDVAAGKEEISARRIGRDELAAIDVCAALADSQVQYFSQKHGGVKQYAQKFISEEGKQNGLYWPEASGQPKSPLGPLVAFATAEGVKVESGRHQPFYGYYFAILDKQGPDAKGGAKTYISNGKMTGGFAVVAYPAQYGDSGIMTFIINQSGVPFQKDLGTKTNEIASAMTEFNPDEGWKPVGQ